VRHLRAESDRLASNSGDLAMVFLGDPTGWFATDLAAIDERITRGRSTVETRDSLDPAADNRERRYQYLVENCLGLICTHDLEGTILSVNPAAAESLGYEPHEGIGRNLREFLSPDTSHLFAAYLAGIGQTGRASGVMRVVRKDGTERLWMYRNVLAADPGGPRYVLGHAIDVTDRVAAELALRRSQEALRAAHDELEAKVRERTAELTRANEALIAETEARDRLERQLREAQQLEVTGRFAGGVAHAFNNLLTVILGGGELIRDDVTTGSARALLEDMMHAANRGAALTRQLLAVGGRQVLHHDRLDVNAILVGFEHRMRQILGPRISLVLSLDPGLEPIEGDRLQIELAVSNLVANARDAIADGGVVTISTFMSSASNPHDAEPSGQRVTIAIRDTGRGMDAETKAHLFEPFFTTKGPETGTGLGLLTVYGILHQHGGTISIDSEVARGSTFTIAFPAAVSPPSAQQTHVPAAQPTLVTETILVVDDEDRVRVLMKTALERQGYTVLAAANGLEALRLAEQYADRVHLLVTDVVMPDMNGRQLFEQLAKSRPDIKVLFVSGYTKDVFQDARLVAASFLAKPFQLRALAQKVREVLDMGHESG
jgi:PAS domain S-box-containing protein